MIYRRFQQLLIPFFCWALINILIYPPYHIDSFVNAILYPDGSFWFLWVLFFITVFFYIGDWIAEKLRVKQEYVIAVLCLVFVVLMVVADIRILGFQFIAYYFLFYSVGYYLHKYDKLVPSKAWLLALLASIWAVMAWFWNMHELPAFLSVIPLPRALIQYGYRFITAAIAVYVLFGIAPKWLNNEYRWNNPWLQLGKISLGVYTVHLILMPFIVRIVTGNTTNIISIVFFSFVIGLLFSWIIVYLLSKRKITARLLLGKIQII